MSRENKMICKNCGNELHETDKYCPNCGWPVDFKEFETDEPIEPQQSENEMIEATDEEVPSEIVPVVEDNNHFNYQDNNAFNQNLKSKIKLNPKIIIGVVAAMILIVIIGNVGGSKSTKETATKKEAVSATAATIKEIEINKPKFSTTSDVELGALSYSEPTGWKKEIEDASHSYYPTSNSSDGTVLLQYNEYSVSSDDTATKQEFYDAYLNKMKDEADIEKEEYVEVNGKEFLHVEGILDVDGTDYRVVNYTIISGSGCYTIGLSEKDELDEKMDEYFDQLVESIEYSQCFDGHSMSEETIAKLDHVDDNNWVVVTEPTESSDGLKATHCANCGEQMQTETISITTGQKNAIRKAKSYLDFMAFSRSGLIDQLEFEGFSNEEATFAVDNITVDWNEQAAKKAESYLEFMSFSKSGLIEQLEFEGFTYEQAVYGAEQNGY